MMPGMSQALQPRAHPISELNNDSACLNNSASVILAIGFPFTTVSSLFCQISMMTGSSSSGRPESIASLYLTVLCLSFTLLILMAGMLLITDHEEGMTAEEGKKNDSPCIFMAYRSGQPGLTQLSQMCRKEGEESDLMHRLPYSRMEGIIRFVITRTCRIILRYGQSHYSTACPETPSTALS